MKAGHLRAHPEEVTLPGQVPNLCQEDYERIAIGHLEELRTRFGELTELWFDGTYPVDLHDTIKSPQDDETAHLFQRGARWLRWWAWSRVSRLNVLSAMNLHVPGSGVHTAHHGLVCRLM